MPVKSTPLDSDPTPQDGYFFFMIIKHSRNKLDVNWEAVANEMCYANAHTAKVCHFQRMTLMRPFELSCLFAPTPHLSDDFEGQHWTDQSGSCRCGVSAEFAGPTITPTWATVRQMTLTRRLSNTRPDSARSRNALASRTARRTSTTTAPPPSTAIVNCLSAAPAAWNLSELCHVSVAVMWHFAAMLARHLPGRTRRVSYLPVVAIARTPLTFRTTDTLLVTATSH